MALSNKQKVFIEEYLICWNATEAARRAGYSEKYLHTNANKLLQNTTVKAEIDRRLEELTMTADEVLKRYTDMGRGDIGDFADIENSADLAKHPLSRIVKKYKKKIYRPKDKDGEPYEEIELELYDAKSALDSLAKKHGLFNEPGSSEDRPFYIKEIVISEAPVEDQG